MIAVSEEPARFQPKSFGFSPMSRKGICQGSFGEVSPHCNSVSKENAWTNLRIQAFSFSRKRWGCTSELDEKGTAIVQQRRKILSNKGNHCQPVKTDNKHGEDNQKRLKRCFYPSENSISLFSRW